MRSEEKLEILRSLNEDQLIDKVIVPLLEGMQFKDITKTHKQIENGIDLIFYEETKFGDRKYTGTQVKAVKIHGSAGKRGSATEILNQAQQAFCYSFLDIYDGKQKTIDEFIVMTSDEVIPSAKESIEGQLKRSGYNKSIHFFDGRKLVDLIDKHMPSFFWEEYEYFNKYFTAMKKRFETIEDVTAIGQREPIPLEEIYVSLRLTEKREHEIPVEKEVDEREWLEVEKHKREQVFEADDAVRRFERVVIVGAPGSGKSTLLKHLTLKSCKQNLEKQERTIVPVLITLGQFSESGKSLRDYMDDVFDRFNFPNAKEFIEKDLKEGKCQLLLDGFDELATRERQSDVTNQIEEFIRTYPRTRLVVTSRIAGYHDELRGFEKLQLLEFDDRQIEQFITNWFGKTNPGKAVALNKSIRENEKIRALARNPLMVAIIAVIYEEDRQLPQRRVELYARCVDVLLSRWDVAHRVKNTYDAKAKEKILRKLALDVHISGKRSFTKEEVLRKFSECLPEVKIVKEKAEDVLDEIVQRNALLREISMDVYDFRHLSFQEYLAALELKEKGDYETVLEHLYDPWWEEVILLFAGFDRDASALIEKVWEKERSDERFREDIFYNNLTLLGKCVADADYTSREVADRIVNALWSLYRTGTFRLLREKAIGILALIKPEHIVDSLIGELENEDSSVRGSAAVALGEIGSEKAIDPLVKALSDKDSSVRWSAAVALGRIGSEKAIDPLVKALSDEHSSVRRSAAVALGSIGSEKAINPLKKAIRDEEITDAAFASLEKISRKTKIRITTLT